MGTFITDSSTPVLFVDGAKVASPGLSVPSGLTVDNILKAADANALHDGLFDARNDIRERVFDARHYATPTLALAACIAAGGGVLLFRGRDGSVATTVPLYFIGSKVRLIVEHGAAIVASGTIDSVIKVGKNSSGVAVPVTDFRLEGGGLIDGNSTSKPVRIENCTRSLVQGMRIQNSNFGIVGHYDCVDARVVDCDIATATAGANHFGDGIYFGGVTRPQALNNRISGVTRIGIVCESNMANSGDALIAGNYVTNANNAYTTESNAGIWCENTNGALIYGNRLSNLTNTPGTNPSYGVVINSGADAKSHFLVRDNVITEANIGISASVSSVVSTVLISGNEVRKGTLTAYTHGVYIGGAQGVTVENNFFDDNTQPANKGVVHAAIVTATSELKILNNRVGTMTHDSTTADLLVESGAANIGALYLEGLDRWRVQMRTTDAPAYVYVDKCRLTIDGTTYCGLNTTGTLKASNSYVTQSTGTTAAFGNQDGGVKHHFDTCTLGGSIFFGNSGAAATLASVQMANCEFLSGHSLRPNGKFAFSFSNCRMQEWSDSHGSLQGNDANTTLEATFSNCHWRKGASTASPFQPGTHGFSVLLIGTDCTTDTAAMGVAETAGTYVQGTT